MGQMGAQSCNFYNFGSHFLQFLLDLLAQACGLNTDKCPCFCFTSVQLLATLDQGVLKHLLQKTVLQLLTKIQGEITLTLVKMKSLFLS